MNQSHEPEQDVEAALRKAMRTEMPPEVRDRLRLQLAAFRGRLEGAAASGHRGSLIPRWMARGMSITATAALVIVVAMVVFGSRAEPTWAQVRERFESVQSFNATIYMKPNAVAEPVQLELWMARGGRVRMRAGNRVVFGLFGQPVETVVCGETSKPSVLLDQAQHTIENICEALGQAPEFSFDTLLLALPFEGALSPPLESVNATIADDLVVFDIANEEGPQWLRIWALRESRLPVRLLFWDPNTTESTDVVLSCGYTQSPEFFSPEAFKAALSPGATSEPSRPYLLYRDPGGQPVTPADVRAWETRKSNAVHGVDAEPKTGREQTTS